MARFLLTDTSLRRAAARAKPYRLRDGDGLYMWVRPDGARWWRMDYSYQGKRQTLSLGTYPTVTLAKARERAAAIRVQLVDGIDPAAARRGARDGGGENTFEAVAREWHSKRAGKVSGHTEVNQLRRLENDIFPWLGKTQVGEVRAVDILKVLQRIENSGRLEVAKKARQLVGQILRYAVLTGRADVDPTPALRGAIAPPKVSHMAAITDPATLGKLLLAIDGYGGGHVVRAALKLAPLLFVRPGELRRMEWAELDDLDEPSPAWRIPAEKMKMREPHIVPLCRQSVEILKDLRPLTGRTYPGCE